MQRIQTSLKTQAVCHPFARSLSLPIHKYSPRAAPALNVSRQRYETMSTPDRMALECFCSLCKQSPLIFRFRSLRGYCTSSTGGYIVLDVVAPLLPTYLVSLSYTSISCVLVLPQLQVRKALKCLQRPRCLLASTRTMYLRLLSLSGSMIS